MPANLTPQYHKAEQAYRQATSPEEELSCLQEMLRELPKHKGTDRLQADLKQKISRLKQELQSGAAAGRRGGHGSRIPRQGAGRVVLLGGPNSGKSAFLAAVTRAQPEVAPYPFTTREPAPAMMPWEDIAIQLIDLPPVTADLLHDSTLGLIRGADLVLLLVDLGADEGLDDLQAVVHRLEHTKTGLAVESGLDEDDIGRSFTRTFLVPNKTDLPEAADRLELLHEFCPLPFAEFPISTVTRDGIAALQAAIFQALDVVRVYTKAPNAREPDLEKPFTIPRGGTLRDVAAQIHNDFADKLKTARVWGCQVHDGTQVKADYTPQDRDIVELHL